MARPVDWQPLAESDPTPGSPKDIDDEVSHMASIAKKLRAQVDDLEKIAKKEGLKGKYSQTLTEGASDLAGKLEDAAGRYETVKSHLSEWSKDLAVAQRRSLAALDLVKSDEGKEEEAKDKLKAAVEYRDDRAGHWAGKIEQAIEGDNLTDSWWDNVKDWIDKNAGWLKVVIEIASYVATALAIAAIFISGIGIGIVLAAAIAVLVARVVMALAGQGSWADVALDIFGIATMGLGRGAVTGLKAGQAATRAAAAAGAKKSAANTAKAATSKAHSQAGRVLADKGASKAQKRAARETIDRLKSVADKSGDGAELMVNKKPLPKVSPREILRAGGDKDAAVAHKDIFLTTATHGDSTAVRAAGEGADAMRDLNQQVFLSGVGIDLGGKALGSSDTVTDKPYLEPFQDYKNEYTVEAGSRW
ncbi:hypothetical protein ACH4GG_06040 [Streptomyces albidoflavus]|uniref:Integral membrane protein n=1 Tax=Streptomyces wadayamensis TaxID=141454 RepID=A0ABR4S692_9ACTN|nr:MULTISPECIES: hypothetical protein [Streptomyces]KDR61166.1 hypothetical protein DC60_28435 [Streptomyces wadayamensis]QXQ24867.1 hypothetical protein STALF2_09205 [Streptomyces albidoflavus]QXQ30793.1 hypothetical protein STALF4_09235 [Streptomyces albidoflavus]RZE23164.1 hypothetical protein C0Q96_21230 [Streptomyces albidoflavus]